MIALQKGLVLHMPLDQESLQSAMVFADKTPYENVGTSANAPVFVADRMGQIRAMQFNGSADYIDCGNAASLDFGAGENFSISFWIKPHEIGSTQGIISKKGSASSTSKGYAIYRTTSLIYFLIDEAESASRFFMYNAVSDDIWQHIVVVVDRNSNPNTNIYVNLVAGTSKNGSISVVDDTSNSNSLLIGKLDIKLCEMNLADVRIYNRIITQQEITALYEMYRPKISLGSLMKGLVLDMPLQSRYMKSATVLTDRTPYSNDGVNSGATIGADYASFNGTSDNIRIPDSKSLSPTSAMTAMAWVKGAAQNNKGILTHWDNGIAQRSFAFFSGALGLYNKARIIVTDDGTASPGNRKVYESSIVVFDDTWYLLGFTFNAGTLKLYIDGVEDTNPTKQYDDAITTIHNSTADVMLGCYLTSNTPTAFFAGSIADVRVYNRALTPAEWLLAFEKQAGAFL